MECCQRFGTRATELTKCIRTNLDCADICATTARVLSRHTGYDANISHALLEACATACRSCGDECASHADMHEHCRICADACRACEKACRTCSLPWAERDDDGRPILRCRTYSALNLRLVLATFGLVTSVVFAVLLFRAGVTEIGWLFVTLTVIAVVDLVVIQLRRRDRRRSGDTDHSLFE